MTEWVTQASDFITQNWAALLGILGGTGGVVSIVTLIGKIILVCVQGHIAKKNGTPLQHSFKDFQKQILSLIESLKATIELLINTNSTQLKEELMKSITDMMQKYQKLKVELYDRLVVEGQDAKALITDLEQQMQKVEQVIKVPEETEIVDVPKEEPVFIEQKTIEHKKNEKIVIER